MSRRRSVDIYNAIYRYLRQDPSLRSKQIAELIGCKLSLVHTVRRERKHKKYTDPDDPQAMLCRDCQRHVINGHQCIALVKRQEKIVLQYLKYLEKDAKDLPLPVEYLEVPEPDPVFDPIENRLVEPALVREILADIPTLTIRQSMIALIRAIQSLKAREIPIHRISHAAQNPDMALLYVDEILRWLIAYREGLVDLQQELAADAEARAERQRLRLHPGTGVDEEDDQGGDDAT